MEDAESVLGKKEEVATSEDHAGASAINPVCLFDLVVLSV